MRLPPSTIEIICQTIDVNNIQKSVERLKSAFKYNFDPNKVSDQRVIIEACRHKDIFDTFVKNGWIFEDGNMNFKRLLYMLQFYGNGDIDIENTNLHPFKNMVMHLGSDLLKFRNDKKQHLIDYIDSIIVSKRCKLSINIKSTISIGGTFVSTITNTDSFEKALIRLDLHLLKCIKAIAFKYMVKALMMEVVKEDEFASFRRLLPFPVAGGHELLHDLILDYVKKINLNDSSYTHVDEEDVDEMFTNT
jgi:hypothetical protein